MLEKRILFEDNHLIAVDKLPGEITQEDGSGISLQDTIRAYISHRDSKPGNVFLGSLHRLDKCVSGIILFAKTSKATTRMADQIRKKKIHKYYCAVTSGNDKVLFPSWNMLSDYIFREKDKTVVCDPSVKDSVQAQLAIKTIAHSGALSLHCIRLETGRRHQIRVQLSNQGIPIIGDRKYGSDKFLPDNRILLHSTYLSFIHPVKNEPIEIFSGIPDIFREEARVLPQSLFSDEAIICECKSHSTMIGFTAESQRSTK